MLTHSAGKLHNNTTTCQGVQQIWTVALPAPCATGLARQSCYATQLKAPHTLSFSLPDTRYEKESDGAILCSAAHRTGHVPGEAWCVRANVSADDRAHWTRKYEEQGRTAQGKGMRALRCHNASRPNQFLYQADKTQLCRCLLLPRCHTRHKRHAAQHSTYHASQVDARAPLDLCWPTLLVGMLQPAGSNALWHHQR